MKKKHRTEIIWGHAGGTYGLKPGSVDQSGGDIFGVTAINAVGPEVIEGRDKILNNEFGR